ncbi:MAG TPA: ATP-binding protein, partial [Burkholderiales bacterium]
MRRSRAARTLSSHAIDVPFALIYLTDEHGRRARLAATAGVAIGEPVSPGAIELGAADQGEWPLARARTDSHIVEVRDLETRFARLPKDSSGAPPHTAAVIPIPSALAHRPAGFLVAAVSPRLRWDEQYRSFLQLAASQIATAIANARAYDEERRRAEALAEIDRAKTAFFSNVSHEFRTPLTLMLGPLADALASPGGALGGAALHAAHRNAQRMLKLVNALLDFSRIEAGRVQAAFEPIDLAATTAELAGVFRSAVERAGLRLVVRCEPLGEPVYVDTVMWEKIVLNLLSNAFKFTFEGEIEVALARTLDGIELKVRDTGIGIAAQDIPKIFERFRRIEGAKARTHEGSGIGLSLVQELVRIHGGRIDAQSEPGKGTTFTVALKRGRGHLPEERVGAARELASTATRAQAYADEALGWLGEPADDDPAISPASAHDPDAGMRVLVADDNADMREYVARLLRARWTVATVANGEAALAALRRERFDLVLTDVMMPRLDGFGLLRAIRSDPALAATPVVMLSARAGEEARIEGLDAGADDYLIKPFGGRELVARVRSQLALLAARRAAERERADLLAREQAAKREAQLQREHLVSLFMQAPNPIVMLRGREHVIQLANPPACRLWGRQPAQVVGRPLLEALPDLRGQVFKELLDRVLHTGVPFEGKEVPANLDPAGDGSVETVYLNFVYAPMRGVTGEIEGVLVVAFDVTDQVRAREQMTRLHAEAEQASRSKDQFLAMLGHELRGPLSPIVNALQILRLRGVQSREQDIVERQVGQITRLVDDLLDVSRIT